MGQESSRPRERSSSRRGASSSSSSNPPSRRAVAELMLRHALTSGILEGNDGGESNGEDEQGTLQRRILMALAAAASVSQADDERGAAAEINRGDTSVEEDEQSLRNSELLAAIRDDDANALRQHFDQSNPPALSVTHVRYAAGVASPEVVALLLDQGAPVEAESEKSQPLHRAVRLEKVRVAQLLLARGASPSLAVAETGWTPLHFSSLSGNLEITKCLVASIPECQVAMSRKKDNWTPAHIASLNGFAEILQVFIDAYGVGAVCDTIGTNVFPIDLAMRSFTETARSSSRTNSCHVMRTLVLAGCLSVCDISPPRRLLAYNASLESLIVNDQLVDKETGAKSDEWRRLREKAMATPLAATRSTPPDTAVLLSVSQAVLLRALHAKLFSAVPLLIEEGAPVNVSEAVACKLIPLFAAIETKDESTVRAILAAGADPAAVNDDGWCALLFSVRAGTPAIGRMLIERLTFAQCRVKEPIHGYTPMHLAAAHQDASVEFLRAFLDKFGGKIMNVATNSGSTPFAMACQRADEEMMELMLGADGVTVATRDEDGATPLHYVAVDTARKYLIEVIGAGGGGREDSLVQRFLPMEKLVRRGALVDVANDEGHSALDLVPDSVAERLRGLVAERNVGVIHANTCCRGCLASPMTGTRWQCTTCYEVLCAACVAAEDHDHAVFEPLPDSARPGERVRPRESEDDEEPARQLSTEGTPTSVAMGGGEAAAAVAAAAAMEVEKKEREEEDEAAAEKNEPARKRLRGGVIDCVVCLQDGAPVLLMPCRHLNVCGDCALRVTTCPTCRKPIADRISVYL